MSWRLAAIVFGIVCAMHVVLMKMFDVGAPGWLDAALFGLLYPGEIVSLVVGGAHGGTRPQEVVGQTAGVTINSLVWIALLVYFQKLRRRFAARPAALQ